jgi:hypothetical protein
VIAETIGYRAEHGSLSFDKAELERLLVKQAESQVTDEILKDVLKNLKNHINIHWMRESDEEYTSMYFIAAQFKSAQMRTSLLSATVIEAAFTMIIDRMNNVNTTIDKQYIAFKQESASFSYTDDGDLYAKGVCVFLMERNKNYLDK